jgi:hypothetical protein
MAAVRSVLSEWGTRRIAFTLVALVPLVVWAVLLQGWRNQIFLVTSWFGSAGVLPPEFLEIGHRLHEVAFAMITWPLVVGLLAQFRSPKRHVTGMWLALLMTASLLIAFVVTNFWAPAMILVFIGVPTVIATLLHPAGRKLVSRVSLDRVNRVTLALVIVAAVPLLAFAATQVGLQTGAIAPAHDHAGGGHAEEVHQQHIEFGHFTFTAAVIFAIIGAGLLASLQLPGWWVAAWLAGAMSAVYGLASVAAPEAASNPGLLWSVAMILWGVAFVAAAESTQDAEAPSLLADRSETTSAAL